MKTTEQCKKCGLIEVTRATDTYPYCDVCFWIHNKWYKRAMDILKNKLVPHFGKVKIKEDGYQELDSIRLHCLFSAVLNCGSLNKTPKVPEMMTNQYEHLLTIFPKSWVDKFFEEKK
jgi:hypothetical protein